MNRLTLFVWLVCAALAGLLKADAQPVTTLYSFVRGPINPRAGLTLGPDGNFYGTTAAGGRNLGGTAFRLTTNGVLTTLLSFNGYPSGSGPTADLTLGPDGNFYGTTTAGGTTLSGVNDTGVVFKMTTNGIPTTVVNFNGTNGGHPDAAVTLGPDGCYYGTTEFSGSNNVGTVFKVTTNGTLTTLVTFNNTNGANPVSCLTLAPGGTFYGTTKSGGMFGFGTAFKLTTNGDFTMLHSFNQTNLDSSNLNSEGAWPAGRMVLGPDGNLYGTTAFPGSAFEMTTNGAVTTLVNFDTLSLVSLSATNGEFPYSGLALGPDGNYYGTTSQGGANGTGTIFQVSTNGILAMLARLPGVQFQFITNSQGLVLVYYSTNNFATSTFAGTTGTLFMNGVLTTLYSFSALVNSDNGDGADPESDLTLGPDGNFYGTTVGGGTNGAGAVFKISTNGTFTALASFAGNMGYNPYAGVTAGPGGSLYGVVTSGGTTGYGTAYKVSAAGQFTLLHNFSYFPDGANPQAALIQGPDGNFYGTAVGGGTNLLQTGPSSFQAESFGTVFKLATNGALTTLAYFNGTNGANPYGGLAFGLDGNFYGTTAYGGISNNGVVFRLLTNGTLTALTNFTGANGANPYEGLTLGLDGSFYGTCEAGGTNGNGTVFQVTTNGALTTLVYFNGTNGANPNAGLMLGRDGSFYGTTYYGGAGNFGTVFKVTTGGMFTTLFSFAQTNFGYPHGAYPVGGLALGPDGCLYGTTALGGVNNFQGTLFKITTNGTLTTLYSFAVPNGSAPFASLTLQTNSHFINFYGTTLGDGGDHPGTVFRVNLTTSYSITENTTETFSPLTNEVVWATGGVLGLVSAVATNGTAQISGPDILFTPTTNFTGTATITYNVSDSAGGINASFITILVTNIPPVANPDFYTVAENSSANVLSPLTNDLPVTSGGVLSLVSVSPTNGTAAISGTNVLFTPQANFVGIATIGYTITDNIGGTNSSLITVTVVNLSADLSLSASAAPNPVDVGSNLVYSITVSNAGPSTATSVTVSNQLPAAVTFISATGGATPSGGILLVSLGSLAAGATGSAQMTVQPSAAGQLTNLFQVSATQTDPNLANNSATVITTVTNATPVTNVILYTVVDLGTTNLPVSINNKGEIIGSSQSTGGTKTNVGLYWTNSSSPVLILSQPGSSTRTSANHINNYSQIVGELDDPVPGEGLYWSNSASLVLDISGVDGAAIGMNDAGQIVGTTNRTASQKRAVYWANSQSALVALATLGGTNNEAVAINNSGGIVGEAQRSDGMNHAAFWLTSASTPADLGTLGGTNSEAIDINDTGNIVGGARASDQVLHAVFWTNSASTAFMLADDGGLSNLAAHVNSSGQIVGVATVSGITHAVLWTNSASPIFDLNNLISPSSGWTLLEAVANNDLGEIVGVGITNGVEHGFALILANPPAADLSLTASAAPNPVGVGSNLVYSITVSNAGPATATDVTVSNRIPANATFVSASGGATPSAGVLLVNLGSLAAGATDSAQVVVQPMTAGQFTNMFAVSATQPDPNLANNSATVVSTVTNTGIVFQIIPGTPLTGSVPLGGGFPTDADLGGFVFGSGPIELQDPGVFTAYTAMPGDLVVLTDPTGGNNPTNWAAVLRFFNPADPTGISGLAASDSQAFFATNLGGSGFAGFQLFPNVYFNPVLSITTANGITDITTLDQQPGPAGVIPAGTTVDTLWSAISPFTDVSLTASATPQPVGVGSDLVYTLTVSNAFTQYAPNTVTATGVVISNQIPANCTFVSATGGATPTNGVLLINLGSLAEGTNTSVQIVVQPTATNQLTNVFQVFANQFDPDLTNNFATVISTVTNAVSATNTVLYEVIDLGTLGGSNSIAYAINNSDLIAGKSEPSGGAYHAAFWTNILIAPVNLGSAILSLASDATAINQPGNLAGVISGSGFNFHAAYWTNSSSPPMDLGTLAGGNASAAYSVNDSGAIVGYSAINDSGSEAVACFWTNSASPGINLGALGGTDGAANSINSSGQIVGSASTSGGASHAAYWTNYTSPPIDLGTLGTGPNSEANCINNIGAIAGDSDVSGSTSTGHAAYWAGYSGSPQDLGLLPNGVSSIATCLNNLGEIVGMCDFSNNPARPLVAVVWNGPGSAAKDLNTLIPTNSNWYLVEANGINDLGVIVGAGIVTNAVVGPQLHAFALIPITNADLSITATAVPTLVVTVVPADYQTVTNFITVSNAGPATATGVVVSNQIPAGITFDSATGGATPAGDVLLINVDTLAVGASVSLQVLETPTNAILYTNVFTVSGNQPDLLPANNSATDTFSGEGLPTTSFTTSTLSVTDNIPSMVSEQNTNFTTVLVAKMPNGTVVYSNAFTTTFSDPSVQAAIVLAAEDLTNNGASGYTGPTETGAGQGLQGVNSVSVTNLVGTNFTTVGTEYVGPTNIFVGPNQSEELTLTSGQDDFDTLITFFFTNDVVTTDTSFYTNTAVYVMTGIVPQASVDLTITANGLPNPVGVGSNLTYSITVSNATPNLRPADSHLAVAPATDVTISNRIPAGVTFVSATGGATPTSGLLLMNLGSLDAGSSASAQVVVKPIVAGQLTNWFAVFADESNSTPANGLAMTVNTVTNETPPTVDLALGMIAVPAPVEAGTPLTYSLTVTNNSAATAAGVVVSNTLPANVTLNSVLPSAGSYTTSGREVTVLLGSLATGTEDSIAIVVIPNAAGQLTNKATVSSAQTDSVLTNNSATNITTAVAVPITNLVLTVLSGITLNPQTGLFEEQVKVSNGGPTTPASVLVLISGLGANITLYNATGTTNGTPYAQSPGPLAVGSNIVFLLEYYSPTRTTPHPTLTAVAGPVVNPPVITGTVMGISRTVGLSNGDVLVEFATIPGRIYAVQYSSDLSNWQTALPVITAPANRVQWIDAGPPGTASSPTTAPARYYRVVLLP